MARLYIACEGVFTGQRVPYCHVPTETEHGVEFRVGMVADQDENSKVDDVTWKSYLKTGTLTMHDDGSFSVSWDRELTKLQTHISEKGRGAELSELIVFNGHLYTVDDRSGIGENRISVGSLTSCGVYSHVPKAKGV